MAQGREAGAPAPRSGRSGRRSGARPLDDDALLDLVQRRTLAYFWDFAHPTSGLARERSNRQFGYGPETVTTGGSGFGIMALLVGVERGWLSREAVAARLLETVRFLARASSYHGVFPHFLDGETGRTTPFTRKDDGGDIVETAFLMMGLLCARQYLDAEAPVEKELRLRILWLWDDVEWDWHAPQGDVLLWHWSPNHGWAMRHEIRGWNECLVAYVLAAGSARHPIGEAVYHQGWAMGPVFRNGRRFFDIELPLGPDLGGPLFFSHYSFMGLDPRGLVDRYADYWRQNVAHTAINRAYCIANPKGFAGYGPDCWGLTASDSPGGYAAHAPDNDRGVISPTAALSAMPYAPAEAMRVLRHLHGLAGDRLWTCLGFADAFSAQAGWTAASHLAIDQGPIVAMIENHRSGLLWRLFMSCPEVQTGLRRLGFASPHLR
jgi:hypothetical protein